jgi:hypothetical protein
LFNIERFITKRTENGLQLRRESKKLFADLWIDWEQFIERGSPYKEVFTLGSSNNFTLLASSKWKAGLPIQLIAHHHGGQIDTDTQQMTMQWNVACGLQVTRKFERSLLYALTADVYAAGYRETSNSGYFPYRQGTGLYANFLARTKILDMMLSYWNAQGYLSPTGGYIYSSRSVDDPAHTEKNRRLIFVRLMKDFQPAPYFCITTRFEPVYDIRNGIFDYSYSLYLSYNMHHTFR